MKARILISSILLIIVVAHAQPYSDSLWSRTFGGVNHDECQAMLQTTDGGYILAGVTESFGTPPAGQGNIWLVKTSVNGDSLWSRAFGGSSDDRCTSILQTSDGGFILAGRTISYGAGGSDFWLLKTNSSGDSLWSHTYGGNGADACNAVQQTSDGGFILAGETQSFGSGGSNFWIVKTSANGDSLWSRAYGGNAGDWCYSVQQTSDGGYLLAGQTGSYGTGISDFWLVKTNAGGDSLWSRHYGGYAAEQCRAVLLTEDGGYLLVGHTYSFGHGLFDYWVVKTNANGDSLWSHTYGGSDTDIGLACAATPDGGYLLAGYTQSFGAGYSDCWVVRTDSNGDSLWSRTFGGSNVDFCYTVQSTSDSGYVIGGSAFSFGAGSSDFWMVKSEGATAAHVSENSLPQSFALSGNYPNPFNPGTTIQFQVPHSARVAIRVHDLLGRELAVIADEIFEPGTHSVSWNCRDCASGIYLISLSAEGVHLVQKAMLLR